MSTSSRRVTPRRSPLLAAGFASLEEFLEWAESATQPQIEAIGALIAEIAAAQQGGDQ